MKKIEGLMVCLWCAFVLGGCGGSDDNSGPEGPQSGELQLSVDHNVCLNDGQDRVTFKVLDGTTDVTGQCTIVEKNSGKEIGGKTFSSTSDGEYRFVAKYGTNESNEVKVTVSGEVTFVKNVVIVQSTSVWCGWCPQMDTLIREDVMAAYPGRVSAIAIHTSAMGTDKMAIKKYDDAWRNYFYITTFPTLVLDHFQMFLLDSDHRFIMNLFHDSAPVGLALSTSLEDRKLTVNVTIRASVDQTSNCRLLVALTEDGIIDHQEGISKDPVVPHDWVLRNCLTDIFGDRLGAGVIRKNNEYGISFTTELEAGWDLQKMHAVVYLIDGDTKKALNSREVKLGESVGYPFKK